MSKPTAIDVCNMALSAVGAEGQIVAFTDTTKEARLCNLHYDPALRAVLRMHLWNFAIDRLILSPDLNPPAWGDLLGYPIPDYVLRVITTDDSDKIYKVEGGRIITDEATLNLKVISFTLGSDSTKWDSLFVQALSTYIAVKICYPITRDNDLKMLLLKELDAIMPRARHVDATEDYPSSIIADEFVNVRMGPNRGWVRDPQT